MTRKIVLKDVVKVQPNGDYGCKATIPKTVAKELGIGPGDLLMVGIEDGKIVMVKKGVLA